ncbi:MAG: sulfatase-like hydrolase/transferase [Chthoniobacterales bacterium]|nr:sulfatase-like hydrolase/transferase [Chthoniobacterales bacterium]
MPAVRPNILFIMTDQQRFDTIAALGNPHVYTPNLDRLVRRGLTFSRAYASCPVCVAARYTIRTGCEPPTTRVFSNTRPKPVAGQATQMEERCGPYLGRVMSGLGYRTFGIGKFHTAPWDEDLGYETFLRSEETYNYMTRQGDGYAAWLGREHPEFNFVEQLLGERTEMYYMPQRSPLPAELGVESWAADRAIEQIGNREDGRPYFGFVSFIGPHPPLAPPIPFNRMYDPDRMPDPVLGEVEQDNLDEEIPYMRYAIWADAINASLARIVKARYYGEISYIDSCLGRILDGVEASAGAENTLICFFSDHGDLLGDHHGWQKQNFFEGSCRIPFLLSWPAQLPTNARRSELVSLADLFGIATRAGGAGELRDGVDVLGLTRGEASPRPCLVGMAEPPGSEFFKVMVVEDEWKYIFMANGRREQLFDLQTDPNELKNCAADRSDIRRSLYAVAVARCGVIGASDALEGDDLRSFPYHERPRKRIYQFDQSRGVQGFPEEPHHVLKPAPRETYHSALSVEPIESLGMGLSPGDSHYRAFVGPPDRYDLVAAMTFNLLTTLGLRQNHSLLDLGCGSLRVGRVLIPYLNRGKYFGLEPNEWLVQDGIRNEIGETLLRIKRPRFLFTDSPLRLQEVSNVFDFAIAQSIFSHCGLDLIAAWLGAIAKKLASTGALVATFFSGDKDSTKAGWTYPGCVTYKPDTLERLASGAGLRFEVLDWRHPRQTWALFAPPQFDTLWFRDKPLTWNTRMESLTDKA